LRPAIPIDTGWSTRPKNFWAVFYLSIRILHNLPSVFSPPFVCSIKLTTVILMVDANQQRENLLPREKAFAYRMKLEAMKRQGKKIEATSRQVEQIAHCFPKPRKSPKMSHLEVMNALLYVLENGCECRALPSACGNWHTVYVRLNRRAKSGVLQTAFLYLQQIGMIRVDVRIVSLDSTSIKVHPDEMGALKKRGKQSVGKSRGGWNTKIHMAAASDRDAMIFELSSGEAGDAPESRNLLKKHGKVREKTLLLMDRAYEDKKTRALAVVLG
jgi:transposase